MREREIGELCKLYRVEADVFFCTAGSNVQSIMRDWTGSIGVLGCGERINVVHAYLRDPVGSVKNGRSVARFGKSRAGRRSDRSRISLYYQMLNRRHQKRSMKRKVFNRIWSCYVKESHLTENIWNWKPKLV
jgi:hypothetical protein